MLDLDALACVGGDAGEGLGGLRVSAGMRGARWHASAALLQRFRFQMGSSDAASHGCGTTGRAPALVSETLPDIDCLDCLFDVAKFKNHS